MNADSIALRLHTAGYKTACIGGFVYSYSSLGPPNGTTWYVAPGWDKWWVPTPDPVTPMLGYTVVTGVSSTFLAGSTDADFLIDKMGVEAVAWIAAREAANERPWFCYRMPPPGIPTRHVGAFDSVAAWRPASYNEADVTDKCAGIEALATVDSAFVDQARKDQLCGMLAIDDLCKTMFDAVQAYDPTNTVLVLIGQGGQFWGEHRLGLRETYPGTPPPWLRFASNQPYDEAHRMTLMMVFPKELAPGSVEDRLVLAQDITATLVRWANGSTTGLYGNAMAVCGRTNRKTFPLEGWQVEGEPFYTGTRTRTSKVFTWYTAETETYDLVADPNEMSGTLT
jgi:hypothetical protein